MLRKYRKFILALHFIFFHILFFPSMQAAQGVVHSSAHIVEKPIVVVIASYNNNQWYKKNLDSLFNQHYSNYRIVYIDDCSPDGTGDLVERYIHERRKKNRAAHERGKANRAAFVKKRRGKYEMDVEDPPVDRIILVKNKERKLKMANTYMAYHTYCEDDEIVVELDGDDWLSHNEVLSKINDLYSRNDIWMTYGHFMEWPTGRPQIMRAIPQSAIDNNTVKKLSGCMWAGLRTYYAWLVKRVKLEDLLYKGRFLPFTSDAAIMFRMFEMAGNRFAFVTDDMFLQHNVATPLNDHKVDRRGLAGAICRNARRKSPYSRLDEPQIGFIDALEENRADVIIFIKSTEGYNLDLLLHSIDQYVAGRGKTFIIRDEKTSEQGVDTSTIKARVQECLDFASDHVLLLTDEYIFNDTVDINECIKNLEETQAHGFFLALGKNSPGGLPVHVNAVGRSYAWQFRYGGGAWACSDSLNAVLYRTSDVRNQIDKMNFTNIAGLERQWCSKKYVDKIGLFFERTRAKKL